MKIYKLVNIAALLLLTGCNLTMTMVHSVGADSGSVKETSEAAPDVSVEASVPLK